jgi:hypothetical protein
MAAIFTPRANLAARVGLLALAGLVVAGIGWWWLAPRTDYARRVGWTITQPVPFSHQHHVSGLGIDCRFCHAGIQEASQAPMPPTWTCMTCHSQIWTNAALLAPVRASLVNNQPIAWAKVTNLPQYVFFNHAIHVAKGVGCASCHGDVAQMALMSKAKSLTMQFCLDCHRDPGPQLRPESAIFDTGWRRDASTPSPDALLAHYHLGPRNLTDCSICHR